jgi:hypothetical protein
LPLAEVIQRYRSGLLLEPVQEILHQCAGMKFSMQALRDWEIIYEITQF